MGADLEQVGTHRFARRWWPVCGSASPLWRLKENRSCENSVKEPESEAANGQDAQRQSSSNTEERTACFTTRELLEQNEKKK